MEENKVLHDDQTRCDLCARYAHKDALEFFFQSGRVLCADCQVEEESCGCEDVGD